MTPLLGRLASLKFTAWLLPALGAGAMVHCARAGAAPWWLLAPLAGLSVNLLAAILVAPRFRRQAALLVFHLCLLAVLALVAAGRLTYLDARVEIAEGQSFDPGLVEILAAGPLHHPRLAEVRFEQGEIQVDYAPRLVRGHTRSSVRIPDAAGGGTAGMVGDDTPLIAAGYHFYTTPNKGYAAVLTWEAQGGRAQTGTVHFPSYPMWDWKQVQSWQPPVGAPLQLELALPQAVPMAQAWTLRAPQGARLRVIGAGLDRSLQAGDRVQLDGGILRLEAVRLWMGYRIFFDPTLPWLFSAAVLGVLALAWHFLAPFRLRLEAASAARVRPGDVARAPV